jgi:inner membrane protein YidH
MDADQSHDPRVPLASERTLLAWIRTALAMMGLGFVVARFGLFLREIAAVSRPTTNPQSVAMSLWIGTSLVLLGVTVAMLAAVRHVRFLDRLARGEPYRLARWSLAVAVACLLSLIGIVMVGFLLIPG